MVTIVMSIELLIIKLVMLIMMTFQNLTSLGMSTATALFQVTVTSCNRLLVGLLAPTLQNILNPATRMISLKCKSEYAPHPLAGLL